MKIKNLLLLLITITLFSNNAYSQTTLVAGDLAIVLVNMDDPDQVSVVALTTIAAGTVINLTDNGWLNSGAFRTGEGTDTYTFGTAASCGDVISIPISNMALSTSGDQVIIYQGTAASPTLITAINVEGAAAWQANATNANTSALPTGLTNGTDAVAITEIDNAAYTGATTGTITALKSALFTSTNFSGSNTTQQTAPGSFTVTGGCALPVDLISFTAKISGLTIELNWSTASELNNSHFEIYKSIDTENFELIGTVLGNGNSQSILEYSFTDRDINGAQFYQLKQVDYDGQFEYSDIISVKGEEGNRDILSQTSDKLIVKSELLTRIVITTQSGQVLADLDATENRTINKNEYPNGMFIIQAINAEGMQTIKWINAN